ncbi:MAG: nickel pincer cofactor biosynthesis protein LarC [Verrucomicrobiaceae bacterium]|nr:MAG: nickel pincer cofactor biosynthesis protein LarC [Verrucomicrobiaceae bacterium]
MRILYFDCFSGISGDMTVAALRDLGVEEEVFHRAIASLGLGDEIHAHFSRGAKQNIAGVKFDVHVHGQNAECGMRNEECYEGSQEPHSHGHHSHGDHSHPHEHHHEAGHVHGRNYREIREMLEKSSLAAEVKSRALAVFYRIAVAEGRIHGIPAEDVGFHEVGAADSIADIVAACAGIHALGPLRIVASVPVEGTGWITCAHGKFPIPAPATLEILSGIPLRQVAEETEFITPTGAALLAEFCGRFGTMPEMKIVKTGYGLGTRDTPPRPNVLRAVLGEVSESAESDEISQIETNLDDITPELAAAAMQRLFLAGALDVFFTAAQMKKNRPGFVLSVLCHPDKTDELARILLTETSAFGVRIHTAKRYKLRRESREVETPYGPVMIKLGFLGDDLVQASPEFESCRAVAEAAGVRVRDVHLAASIGILPKPVA